MRRPAGRRRSARGPVQRRRLGLSLGALVAVLLMVALSGIFSGGVAGQIEGGGFSVRTVNVSGVIDPPMADFVIRNIGKAEEEQVRAVVIQLDTPGGLDGPMRDIINKMTGSPLPVAVYVAQSARQPSGAQAVGAGAFIVMGADAAAMSPDAILGPATPAVFGVDTDSPEGREITDDSAAYIRSLAEASGRNANWAELAVRQPVFLTADAALEQQVIDLRADNLGTLLAQLRGFHAQAKNLDMPAEAGGSITPSRMKPTEWIRHFLLNPNVAYFLFVAGLLALAFLFVRRGIGLVAASGVVPLLLSFYALTALPVSLARLALVVAGVGLLVLDLFITRRGALSAAGLIALFLGGLSIFKAPFLEVSFLLNLLLVAVAAALFLIAAPRLRKEHRLPAKGRRHDMIGETGHSRTRLDPLGQVFVRGEIWSAEASEDEIIEKGEEIEIVDVKGLILKVRKTV